MNEVFKSEKIEVSRKSLPEGMEQALAGTHYDRVQTQLVMKLLELRRNDSINQQSIFLKPFQYYLLILASQVRNMQLFEKSTGVQQLDFRKQVQQCLENPIFYLLVKTLIHLEQ